MCALHNFDAFRVITATVSRVCRSLRADTIPASALRMRRACRPVKISSPVFAMRVTPATARTVSLGRNTTPTFCS